MGMEAEFKRLLRHLEDWHADSVRARDYAGSGGSGSLEAGHVILLRTPYPGPDWRARWRQADEGARLEIIDAIKDEIYGLTHSPSQASPAGGLHRGTAEWRKAIANSDDSLRGTARRFGISHTEVRRIKLAHGGTP